MRESKAEECGRDCFRHGQQLSGAGESRHSAADLQTVIQARQHLLAARQAATPPPEKTVADLTALVATLARVRQGTAGTGPADSAAKRICALAGHARRRAGLRDGSERLRSRAGQRLDAATTLSSSLRSGAKVRIADEELAGAKRLTDRRPTGI